MKNWFKPNLPSHPTQPQSNNFSIIELHHVVKKYISTAGSVNALNGVDLHINDGEFVVILGKSGAGKTTLVNMITGIDRPTSGEIIVAGTAVHILGEDKRAKWRGLNVGVVLQSFQLLPSLSVIQNVMLPMDFADRYPISQQRKRAMRLLEQMEIAEHAHKLPAEVSGGQQQRIAIARALANDPPILLADEPTGSLDSITAQSVCIVFQDLVRQGKTIVLVTHDQDLAQQAQRSILIADGEIVEK